MTEPREFVWKNNRYRITFYGSGPPKIEQWIEDRFDRRYWRTVPMRGNTMSKWVSLVTSRGAKKS